METINLYPQDLGINPVIAKPKLTYRQLRMVVVSLSDTAHRLITSGDTFSIQDCGEDYKKLAHSLDDVVSNLDPQGNLLLQEEDEVLLDETLTNTILDKARVALEEIRKQVGGPDYLSVDEKISRLQEESRLGVESQEKLKEIHTALGFSTYVPNVHIVNKIKELKGTEKKYEDAQIKHLQSVAKAKTAKKAAKKKKSK